MRRSGRWSKDQFILILVIGGSQTGALQDVGQLLLRPRPLHQLQLLQLALCLGRSPGEGGLRGGGWHRGLWGGSSHVPCPSGPTSILRQAPGLCRREWAPRSLSSRSCTPEAGKGRAELHPRLGVPLNGLLQLESRGKGREGTTLGGREDRSSERNRHERGADDKRKKNGKAIEWQARCTARMDQREKTEKGKKGHGGRKAPPTEQRISRPLTQDLLRPFPSNPQAFFSHFPSPPSFHAPPQRTPMRP